MYRIKAALLMGFVALAVCVLLTRNPIVPVVGSYSSGPPPGYTGAPNEMLCSECHTQHEGPGQFRITGPPTYIPGQTYPIRVTHTTTDPTRLRWGFQLTALANFTPAGSFAAPNAFSQTIEGDGGRKYIEHTTDGTFPGQAGGAEWIFEWKAPDENLGQVTFYASGNQADNNGNNQGDQIYTTTSFSQPLDITPSTAFDYDADGRSDISIFRPSSGAWYLQRSRDGLFGAEFGFADDRLAPADYDGDGRTDIAVYRPSTGIWYVFNTVNSTVSYFVFGLAEDLPVPADYDGDGKADIAVFRPSTATWYRQNSSDGSFFGMQFGLPEDKPTIGDFDGDARADIAVFRPSVGAWYQFNSSTNQVTGEAFGFGSDIIVPADYDGDHKTDLAVYRPSNGFWYIRRSNGPIYTAFPFGLPDDIPAPGDFDGDGRADLSVFRPSDGTWYRQNSATGMFSAFPFGAAGDRPTQSAFRY